MNNYDLEDARADGYRAYTDGLKVEDNPYTDDALFEAWKEGYYDAAWDD